MLLGPQQTQQTYCALKMLLGPHARWWSLPTPLIHSVQYNYLHWMTGTATDQTGQGILRLSLLKIPLIPQANLTPPRLMRHTELTIDPQLKL